MRYLFFVSIYLLIAGPSVAQDNLNVSLYAQYNRGDGRASGCWYYAAPDGKEYAILGAQTGTAIIRIDGPNNLEEVGFVPGYSSNWREVTVVGQQAYVVTEGSGSPHYGMQVIELGQLPDTAFLLNSYSATFGRGHIIQKDIFEEAPFVYVCGTSTTQGVHIIDVSNPAAPQQVGLYQPGYYIHDCHVRGDLLFAAAFYEGTVDIVDISDKSNPTLLYRLDDPAGKTHSVSTTEDMQYLFLADEQDGLPGRIFDIQDLENPVQLATYTANLASLVHNPYIRGDFAFITHNTEGLRVVDMADPAVPVEVGYYDTYSGSSGGFNGLWSGCPYLPSGRIIGGNREDGLYVWTFNNARAGRFYGLVVDSLSGEPIFNATITIEGAGDVLQSDFEGRFKKGYLPGNFTLTVTAPGYTPKSATVTLAEGSQESLTVELAGLTSGLAEAKAAEKITVFPNPFTVGATLQLDDLAGVKRVRLIGPDGSTVRYYQVEHQASSLYISRNGLTPGLYWLLVEDETGRMLGTKQLICQ
ncbi:MAG: choice-of-anchor B family protein [Lewinellaceae bacterium]|nr:choice-of-anchor B family protein [Lewinellaceae bacterium]